MAWSGGTFTRAGGSTNWADDRDAAVEIEAGLHDTHDQDLADGINACLKKDGGNSATGNLNLGANKLTNVADPTSAQDASTKAYVDFWRVPTGFILPAIYSTAPTGWLLCNGDTIGKAGSGADHEGDEYEALFDYCKAYFGNAGTESFSGLDTVAIPNLGGEFLRFWDDDGDVDSGRTINSSQSDQNKAHDHGSTGSAGSHSHTLTISGSSSGSGEPYYAAATGGSNTLSTDGVGNHTHTTASSGGTEVRVRNYAFAAMVKV